MAQQIRRRLEHDGQAVGDLRACDAEGRDGTHLGGCAKVYLPAPDGPSGMVFLIARDRASGRLYLDHLAFGLRHPARPTTPSAYQVADRRLHARP